ncbi:hypothetical protein NMY22_g430 [Coprinellus aureogranulatus]|nr:hypothetical protein NMY22_g430 [Coprinellus aureogranulatus]
MEVKMRRAWMGISIQETLADVAKTSEGRVLKTARSREALARPPILRLPGPPERRKDVPFVYDAQRDKEFPPGQHTDLFRAREKEGEGALFAVKVLRAGSGEDPVFFEALQKRLVDFGDVWGQLRHENIARVYGVGYNFSRLPGIIMNYYEETVMSYMRAHPVDNDAKLEWIKQIASGLKYLHTRRPPIVHGDLRGANIFVDSTGKCVIADVGMAFLTEMAEFLVMRRATSCRWTAPELMDPDLPPPTTEGPYWTTQTDVFAFAITAIEIFSEAFPFKEYQNDSPILFLIVKGDRPEMTKSATFDTSLAGEGSYCNVITAMPLVLQSVNHGSLALEVSRAMLTVSKFHASRVANHDNRNLFIHGSLRPRHETPCSEEERQLTDLHCHLLKHNRFAKYVWQVQVGIWDRYVLHAPCTMRSFGTPEDTQWMHKYSPRIMVTEAPDITAVTPLTKLPDLKLKIIPSDEITLTPTIYAENSPCYHPFASGGYADIYKATRTTSGGVKQVVVKVFRNAHLQTNVYEKQKYINRLRREYGVWSALDHRNIHVLEGIVIKDALTSAGLVSEYKPLGSLESFLKSNPGALTGRLSIAQGVACGLEYLHENEIVHGDLTIANILLDRNVEDGTLFPKISDFGKSRILERDGYTTKVGDMPYFYRPPELLLHSDLEMPSNKEMLFPESDVYSLSLVLLELLTGKRPYSQETLPHFTVCAAIVMSTTPLRPCTRKYPMIDPDTNFVWPILEACWKTNPADRISSKEAHLRLCQGTEADM